MRHRTSSVRSAAILVPLLASCGCGGSPGGTTPPPGPAATRPLAATPRSAVSAVPSPFRFEALDRSSGIAFVHESGMTEEKYFASANGSGVAVIDYDNDGKMDLYFATCNDLPLAKNPAESNRLYRNLGDDKFEDVTEKAGVGFKGFCHGVVAADLDNDGDTDMLLCNYGANVLYLNNGDGTFKDVSKQAGVSKPNWSSGGAVLDYDNDGRLDIYVANYGLFDLETNGKQWCGNDDMKVRQYCSPASIKTVQHILYHNDGLKDGVPQFSDATVKAGVARDEEGGQGYGHGFGVVSTDLNGDGRIDLYVANDQNPAFVFYNKGDGTFEDATVKSGAAYDEDGKRQSGMGADAEDSNGDGKPEIVRTNFREETTSFYENQGDGIFLEQSATFGIKPAAMPWVKWGCGLVDFDNDGWPDLFVSNGHVDDNYRLIGVDNQPYKQPPTLYANKDGVSFGYCSPGSGAYFESDHVGRGVAFGDVDNDGRPDIIVNHKDDAPAVLMNRSPGENRWVRLILKGTKTNRDAIGARVQVIAGGRTIYRQKKGGGSMESTNDPRLLIGVGTAAKVDKIVVKWPSGSPDTVLENIEPNKDVLIEEGLAPK